MWASACGPHKRPSGSSLRQPQKPQLQNRVVGETTLARTTNLHAACENKAGNQWTSAPSFSHARAEATQGLGRCVLRSAEAQTTPYYAAMLATTTFGYFALRAQTRPQGGAARASRVSALRPCAAAGLGNRAWLTVRAPRTLVCCIWMTKRSSRLPGCPVSGFVLRLHAKTRTDTTSDTRADPSVTNHCIALCRTASGRRLAPPASSKRLVSIRFSLLVDASQWILVCARCLRTITES